MNTKPILPACFQRLKSSLVLLLVLAAFTPAPPLKAAVSKIAPGVDYEQTTSHGTTIHILQIDLLQAQLSVYALTDSKGHPIPTNVENMADKLGDLAPGDQEVVAGINAGFFGLGDGVNLSRTVSPYTPDIRYNLPEFYRQEAESLGMEGNDQDAQDRQNRFERMRSRFELIIAGDSVRISPAGLQDADKARQQGWSIIGGGGQLLPGRPASLGVVKELAPDPDFTSQTSRTAAGYAKSSPNVFYLITVDKGTSGGVTIAELADIVKNLGFGGKPAHIDTAIAMDGGGSTQMWLKDKGTVSKNEKGGGTRKVTTGIFVLGNRAPLTGPTCFKVSVSLEKPPKFFPNAGTFNAKGKYPAKEHKVTIVFKNNCGAPGMIRFSCVAGWDHSKKAYSKPFTLTIKKRTIEEGGTEEGTAKITFGVYTSKYTGSTLFNCTGTVEIRGQSIPWKAYQANEESY